MSPPYSIAGINLLDEPLKRAIYRRFIPQVLLDLFGLSQDLIDGMGRSLLDLRCGAGATDVVVSLRRVVDDPDPLLYAHLTDTVNGQVHVLLYVVNDPRSPRFEVDRLPDGTPTEFGLFRRNLEAEERAMRAGLAPGQVRRGLRVLKHSIESFEAFVASLGHEAYFVEPLYYHNAVVFERYGFAYQAGRKFMESIHNGFLAGGDLLAQMDGSTPFRQPGSEDYLRGRSWAIHDGILGRPFSQVTMYKRIGEQAGVETFPGASW